jgi:hypothetical protein
MSFSCAELSIKARTIVCDPLWSLFLGDEDYDDDATLNDTVAGDTLAGYSHLIDAPESTHKNTSKQQAMQKKQSPSKETKNSIASSTDGDKVMEYFLGSGGDSEEDGERAKQTFRRRKKKLQQESTNVPEKPNTTRVANDPVNESTKVELPPQLERYPNVPTKVISLLSNKTPHKYSLPEDREDADIISFDSRSTLTALTVQSARDEPVGIILSVPKRGQPISDTKTKHSKHEETQKSPSIQKKGSASKSGGSPASRRDEKGSASPIEKASGSKKSADGPISRKEKATMSRSGDGSASRREKPPIPRSGEVFSLRKEKTPVSRSGDAAKRNDTGVPPVSKNRASESREDPVGRHGVSDRRHGYDEDQGGVQYPPHHQQRERELRPVASSDKYMSGQATRERSINIPPRAPFAWAASRETQRPMMLLRVPTKGRDRQTNPGRSRVAEEPRSKSSQAPHAISDISRRELELRSIGVHGSSPTVSSNPRLGGKGGEYRYDKSNQRGLRHSSRSRDQPQHDPYPDMYGMSGRSPCRDSRSFVDISAYDEFNGMSASVKLELGARVARQQIKRSMASQGQSSSRFRSHRSVSVPQQRQDCDPEEGVPNLLTAGSLKL